MLGRPVCDDWRAFAGASAPRLPARAFAVGATYRVELGHNGAVVWSEKNPMFALQNAGDTDSLEAARLLSVSADNDQEEQEAQGYLAKAFLRQWDKGSSLHGYIGSHVGDATRFQLTSTPAGAMADLGCNAGILYVRQSANRLYALLSSVHSNDWEYDSHPVLYFVIFAVP